MKKWNEVPVRASIEKAAAALNANGFETVIAKDAAEAAGKALALVPEGAEAFTMASVTLDQIGVSKEINDSGRFDAVRGKLYAMDKEKQGREMRKYGAAPDVALGSVHAVTEKGSLVIASLTGSQLPAYAYGSGTVIFVVGAQKIVADLDEAFKRIETYTLPLESARARKAYGLPDSFNSFPSKMLVLNREIQPGRIKVVLVEESIGF
ncbi:MAG: hypothetical protein A2Z99_09145 [Treponema sp. GWB1_62_6]|nr:MAG: hypothetical protein A2Y36_13945 [Treponema sp. GWA1_62_8]OHE63507.1 MAG: hypothetical protein A2Z99_09145 [Treponema sp. GWB1_62_6]OHE68512.1 MAG: hypothetical protein A2413_04825 [Treponema sp. RIFOXYC1_FULL_61_9]OHE70172.1 MAG: hypothetical protein A2001_06815 [Treponema sp. GWC1_61_84]HCM28447.1 hypothetical protein [Treponema sp.]